MLYSVLAQVRAGGRRVLSGGALAAIAAVLAAGSGIALTSADAVVSRGFAIALEGPRAAPVDQSQSSAPPVAGSEDYWLSRARKAHGAGGRVEPAAWSLASTPFGVAAGDRITITSGGKDRVLEVVAVVEADAEVTRIETPDTAPRRQLIVTCRDTDARGGDLVRFLTDPAPAPASGGKPVRAL